MAGERINNPAAIGRFGANMVTTLNKIKTRCAVARTLTRPKYLDVAQLAERLPWEQEAVRAGLTIQTMLRELEK